MNSQHFLAQHLYPCAIDDLVVLLDLRNDRYIGLEGLQAEIFRLVLRLGESSTNSIGQNAKGESTHIAAATEELVTNGILTTDPFQGKDISFPSVKPPLLDLTGYDVTKKRRVKPDHAIRLVIAAVSTSLMLRLTTLENEINRLKVRKQRHLENSRSRNAITAANKDRIRELVEIFRLIRTFLFTSKNYCLYDSIVLVKFLAFYGIHPDLVVGVKMRPFQAHAWVQDENFIYNCSITDVDLMTPIMSI